jgi:hypothetical protein
MYNTIPSEYVNILVYGGAGTGKTGLVQTCPQPILYHSFDRGGWVTIREFAKDHSRIIIDNRFEGAMGSRTYLGTGKTVFELWEEEFKRLSKMGFFDLVGTYVVDSATTWALSIMDTILKKDQRRLNSGWVVGRKETPDIKDWQIQMEAVKLALNDFTSLPCHCLFIAHETTEKDELTGSIDKVPYLTGKLQQQVPTMFDEVYRAITTGADNKYSLMTQRDGNIPARSRIAGIPPKLQKYEPMDIRAILKKAGAKWEDKPLFKGTAA